MTIEEPRRLRMFAGPNGSGKTSLVRKLAREYSSEGLFQLHRFINADDILRDLRDGPGVRLELGRPIMAEEIRAALLTGGRLTIDHPFLQAIQIEEDRIVRSPCADDYCAAGIADFLREELLAANQSFSFETVMSHRNKVEFFARARAAGYRTYLYFIATEAPLINVYRVEGRAAIGGHDVPEGKIVERYHRCLQLVGDAMAQAFRAFLFDNSGDDPIWLGQQTPEGAMELKVPPDLLPEWFKAWVAPRMQPL